MPAGALPTATNHGPLSLNPNPLATCHHTRYKRSWCAAYCRNYISVIIGRAAINQPKHTSALIIIKWSDDLRRRQLHICHIHWASAACFPTTIERPTSINIADDGLINYLSHQKQTPPLSNTNSLDKLLQPYHHLTATWSKLVQHHHRWYSYPVAIIGNYFHHDVSQQWDDNPNNSTHHL